MQAMDTPRLPTTVGTTASAGDITVTLRLPTMVAITVALASAALATGVWVGAAVTDIEGLALVAWVLAA